MTNPDTLAAEKEALLAQMAAAEDKESFVAAFKQYDAKIMEAIKAEKEGLIAAEDNRILTARGHRTLTSAERKFYEKFIAAAKRGDSQQAIEGILDTIPETIINDVLKAVGTDHPLLEAFPTVNTTGTTTWWLDEREAGGAEWGELGSPITKEATGEIRKISVGIFKLSAWFVISNDFLELGPDWIDPYIRQILADFIAVGLETGMINGTGAKMPIGMMRDVSEGVSVIDGAYPEKEAVVLDALSVTNLSTHLATLATDRKGRARTVNGVVFIVNPMDYFKLIFPATTMLTPSGGYAKDVMPYPMEIITSVAVPQNRAIMGLKSGYFMGLGSNKKGRIETDGGKSEFLEDSTYYRVKLYGNGSPKDNNSFIVFDITNLKPVLPTVQNIPLTSGE